MKTSNQYINNQKGMTLIDVAIAMMVIGLLITPVLYSLKEHKRTKSLETTETNIELVNMAIERYFIENRSYPCPADILLNIDNPNHGTGASTGAAFPADTCDIALVDTGGTGTVYQGAVPHQDLGLSVKQTYDGWGNKILYVVTASMAMNPNAEAETGAIEVRQTRIVPHPTSVNPTGNPCNNVCADTLAPFPGAAVEPACAPGTTPYGDAAPLIVGLENIRPSITYTILTHGPDSIGAYNEAGLEVIACDANADSENCNDDALFLASYEGSACLANNSNDATRFDDTMWSGVMLNDSTSASGGFPSRIFEESQANSDSVGGTASYTGINNDNPQHELDIVGNILVSDLNNTTGDGADGAARSDQYCNADGTLCFESSLIGGTSPRMQCGGGTGMVGIGNNRARCRRQFSQTASGSPCPSGQYVVSLTPGGFVCGP